MPPRAVSMLTLVQLLVVFLGVLLTGTFMRLSKLSSPFFPLPTVPGWVQHNGFWLCLLPLAWAVGATLSVRTLDASPEIRPGVMIAGYVLLAALGIGLIITAGGAISWAFGYHGPMQGG